MKISNRLSSILVNRSYPFNGRISYHRKCNLHGSDVNHRFIHTVNEDNYFIVPVPMLYSFVEENKGSTSKSNIVYPLSLSLSYNIKTLDSMVARILQYTMRNDNELIKVISEKYGTYYGSEGMILDSNFNILLLNAYKCTVEEDKVHVKEIITYVNPIVSLADEGMDKCIYTKIVPTYLNSSVFNGIPNSITIARDIPGYGKPTIIFKDVTSTFLFKPIEPSEIINEDIYGLLDNNIDDLLEMVVKCQ